MAEGDHVRRAIVMISIGDRPWSALSFATFQEYARKFGADAHLIREDVPLEEFDLGEFKSEKGRPNKRAYALKSYIPWKFMKQGYDQVVLVDDSCSVHPLASSIFREVPRGSIGYTLTSALHARKSFETIADFQRKKGEPPIEFNAAHYANSGVVVYDRKFMDAFAPKLIRHAKPLLYNRYPHQTLLYYLVKRANIPVRMLRKKFNSMPGAGGALDKQERANLTSIDGVINHEKAFITHFSGAYRNRHVLIEETSRQFLQMWKEHA